MLLLDKTLLKLAKGLWGWIAAIVAVRFLALVGIAGFSAAIGGFLGTMTDPSLTLADAGGAIRAAALTALLTFASQLAQGELEFRCAAQTRDHLRERIFSKVLELDVGHIEKIGPVSAITASVDAVEQVQLYYSAYLPTLIFSLIAPIYLFLRLRNTSVLVASMLLAVSILLEPVNNLFRGRIEKLRRVYWRSVEDMTAYYLDSVRGLATLKLFNRADSAAETLSQKAERLNTDINRFMRVNFTSNLVTEAMIYLSIVAALVLTCHDLAAGKTDLGSALTVLMLSYSYFSAIRQLMGATHTALTAVSAATKLEDIEAVDTARPFDPALPVETDAFAGIRMENVSFSYEQRGATLKGVSLEIERGKTTALVGLSGCGKSTVAALLMRFSDPDAGRILLDGRDYNAMSPEQLRRHIVMVPQSVSIFSGTIRDNLLLGALKALILESVYGIRDIQIFGIGERRKARVMEQNDAVNRAAHGTMLHQQTVASLPSFFVYLARILIIGVAAFLAGRGEGSPVGTIVVSFVATASFSSSFSLTFVVTDLLETFAAAERLFKIEDAVLAVIEANRPASLSAVDAIEFDEVSFRYPGTGESILKHASFTVRRGEKVGIIGESGAGKSTIVRLLMRFYDASEGEIRYSGVPAKRARISDLRGRIAMLEQDTYLFDGTIRENIAVARPDASLDEIREAARRSGIAGFISTLPQGYDTPMGQMGARLSGGERQRVGIARIMLANPDAIVMDEPTSALDVLHEKELLHTLRTVYADKTLIIISHRHSTLAGCTRILRLEDGSIREINTQRSA